MNTKKNITMSLAALALALVTIMLVFKQAGPHTLSSALQFLKEIPPLYIGAALVSSCGFIWFEGMGIKTILDGFNYPCRKRDAFVYAAADVYFSAITPSASGGQPASVFFMYLDMIPASVSTAVLLLNLVMYTLALVTMSLAALLAAPGIYLGFSMPARLIIAGGITVMTLLGILFILLLEGQRFLLRTGTRMINLLYRLKIIHDPEKYQHKLTAFLAHYGDCVKLIHGNKRMLVKVYIYNVLQRISQLMVMVIVYLGLDRGGRYPFKVFITQLFVAGGSNFIPIPGAMGAADFLMIDGYSSLFSEGFTYALSLIGRGISFYCCILISFIVVVAGFLRKRRQ